MNQLTKDAIDNHFSNIYVRLASFLDKDTITSKENRKNDKIKFDQHSIKRRNN